ncbi:glycosyltransferase, partial [Vibrio cholerae]|nr:glycosyltransferase [Vibrio cholerae]
NNKIKIAYATGRVADENLEKNLELALKKIACEFGNSIEIHFWREPFKSLKGMNNVIRNKVEPNYEKFLREFYISNYDIGLAPLLDDVFYNSKTNNKYREYSGCNVSGIYSNVKLYRDCIQDGWNGVLVDNDENSWYLGLRKLILSKQLREQIASNAKNDVLENYSFLNSTKAWYNLLQGLYLEKSSSTQLSGKWNSDFIYIYKEGNITLSASSYMLLNYIGSTQTCINNLNLDLFNDFLNKCNVSCYYICNGVDDCENIESLSKKFKHMIIDTNYFQIKNIKDDSIYILHDDTKNEVCSINNIIYVPSSLSEDSRDKNSIKYFIAVFEDKCMSSKKVSY